MRTFLFTTRVIPNSPDFWYSTDYIRDISVSVETIAEAREKYAEIIWDDYSIEISKTNQKRPKKMFMDTPNGQKQVGFVFTGMTDIDFGNTWKKRYVSLWTEIYEQVKF